MKGKMLLSAGFVFHMVLGNFCMMLPVAYAMEPDANEPHAEELRMTLAIPMSPAHCRNCRADSGMDHPAPATSACAGHCVSRSEMAFIRASSLPVPDTGAVACPSFASVQSDEKGNPIAFAETPPVASAPRTIVLRL